MQKQSKVKKAKQRKKKLPKNSLYSPDARIETRGFRASRFLLGVGGQQIPCRGTKLLFVVRPALLQSSIEFACL